MSETNQDLDRLVKAEFRGQFREFIRSGTASEEFFNYLNEDADCQKAVDLAIAEEARQLAAKRAPGSAAGAATAGTAERIRTPAGTSPSVRPARGRDWVTAATALAAGVCLVWGLYHYNQAQEQREAVAMLRGNNDRLVALLDDSKTQLATKAAVEHLQAKLESQGKELASLAAATKEGQKNLSAMASVWNAAALSTGYYGASGVGAAGPELTTSWVSGPGSTSSGALPADESTKYFGSGLPAGGGAQYQSGYYPLPIFEGKHAPFRSPAVAPVPAPAPAPAPAAAPAPKPKD